MPIYHLCRQSAENIYRNEEKLAKKRNRRYAVQTITDADYADDIVLMANTTTQAETLLHDLG